MLIPIMFDFINWILFRRSKLFNFNFFIFLNVLLWMLIIFNLLWNVYNAFSLDFKLIKIAIASIIYNIIHLKHILWNWILILNFHLRRIISINLNIILPCLLLYFTNPELQSNISIMTQFHFLELLSEIKFTFIRIILVIRDMGMILQQLFEIPLLWSQYLSVFNWNHKLIIHVWILSYWLSSLIEIKYLLLSRKSKKNICILIALYRLI